MRASRSNADAEREAVAAARWRVAISKAKVEAIKARAAMDAEKATRADRLSQGLTARPSPRERVKQQQMEVNRAQIYAMNAVLARQADARWRDLRREHGVHTPELIPGPAGSGDAQRTSIVDAQQTSIDNGIASATLKQPDLGSGTPTAIEAGASRSKAQGTPPLTPPSAPSSLELPTSEKAWLEAPTASSRLPSPATHLQLNSARQKRRDSTIGCCVFFRRRCGTQIVQQGHTSQQVD